MVEKAECLDEHQMEFGYIVNSIGGSCPLRATGNVEWTDNEGDHVTTDWYFRARGEHWSIEVYTPDSEDGQFPRATLFEVSGRWGAGKYRAGYMEQSEGADLIEFSMATFEASIAQTLKDIRTRAEKRAEEAATRVPTSWYIAPSLDGGQGWDYAGRTREEAITRGLISFVDAPGFALGHEKANAELWPAAADVICSGMEFVDVSLAEDSLIDPGEEFLWRGAKTLEGQGPYHGMTLEDALAKWLPTVMARPDSHPVTGAVWLPIQSDAEGNVSIIEDCETCQGTGKVDETLGGTPQSNPEAECPDCHGKGS